MTHLRRIPTIATWVSTVMLALTLLLAAASYWLNPWANYLSIGNDFHAGVEWRRNVDIRLVFFNDAAYGPYNGSMTSVMGAPPIDEERAFGDTAGIYYRYFRDGADTLWTLKLSLWYPAGLFALFPCWQGFRTLWQTTQPIDLDNDLTPLDS